MNTASKPYAQFSLFSWSLPWRLTRSVCAIQLLRFAQEKRHVIILTITFQCFSSWTSEKLTRSTTFWYRMCVFARRVYRTRRLDEFVYGRRNVIIGFTKLTYDEKTKRLFDRRAESFWTVHFEYTRVEVLGRAFAVQLHIKMYKY